MRSNAWKESGQWLCKNAWHSVLALRVDGGCHSGRGCVGTEQRWWNDTEHKSSKRGRVKAMNNIGRERQKCMGNTTTATATTIEAS